MGGLPGRGPTHAEENRKGNPLDRESYLQYFNVLNDIQLCVRLHFIANEGLKMGSSQKGRPVRSGKRLQKWKRSF